MPKRSNAFQRLAFLLHEHREPGWKVDESRTLTDKITGKPREVDIVLESTVARYPVAVSIECRDHARPADVVWVEAMAKKHEHLPTSKLVLWSRSGFTAAAILKAEALNITTVSHAEAAEVEWARLTKALTGGDLHYVTPAYEPFIDVDGPDGQPFRLEDVSDAHWYNEDGSLAGTIPALVEYVSKNENFGNALLDHADPGESSFWVKFESPHTWYTFLPDLTKVKVRRIGIGVRARREISPVVTASARESTNVTTLFSAAFEAGTLEILIEESPKGLVSVNPKLRPK